MATIDLGVIKPVFKGAYNNSTAYILDNIVASGGSSYICILASTGNAVSNGTYWAQLAEGGDVATTLTTAGDLLYRDGSGLQRLAKGTASQALVMNSGATAPEWGSGGGKVLQVVQSYVQTRGSGTAGSTAFSDVTSQAITLASSSSKVMVSWVISMGSDSVSDNGTPGMRILRASTAIAVGTTNDSRVPATQGNQNVLNSNQRNSTFSGTFLDSPSTSGSVTYKIQGQTRNTGYTWYWGGGGSSSNSAEQKMYPTILTLMEIGA